MQYRINIETNPEGYPVIYLKKNGKVLYLSSRYNPEKEAEVILSKYKIKNPDIVIVLGGAPGFIIKKLFEKSFSVKKVISIEFDKSLSIWLKNFLSSKFNLQKVSIFYLNEIEKIKKELLSSFSNNYVNSIVVVENPVYLKYFQKEYYKIKNFLKDLIEKLVNNQITLLKIGNLIINNTLKNLPFLELNNALNICFKSNTAMLVSAGYSLTKELNYIKELQNKAMIFAVDTSLKFLIKHGILPDYVFSVDPQYFTILHYMNLDSDKKIKVIADISTHPALRKIRGIQLYYSPGKNPVIERKIKEDEIIDTSGGSVTNYAINFLLKKGFKKIILIGLDLCFIDGKMYVPYNYIVDYWLKLGKRLTPIKKLYFDFYITRARVDLKIGDRIYKTSRAMLGYLDYLKNLKREYPDRIVISPFSPLKSLL